jgi:CheY-like chemotaxis protein
MSSEVLFVEDCAGDARLIQEAFRNFDSSIHVQLVLDGAEAMAYLKSERRYDRTRRPDLVLLDLGLPKLDGREVLALVKSHATLKSILVVVLTSSQVDADVWLSYKLQAAAIIFRLKNASVCAVIGFLRDERAATAIEYGLIVTGIAIGTLAVLAVVGAKIKAAFLLLTTGV